MAQTQQRTDPWENVPRAEVERELREYFRKFPEHTTVWLVPCKYSDDTWTCQYCVEFPATDPYRREYRRSFERVR